MNAIRLEHVILLFSHASADIQNVLSFMIDIPIVLEIDIPISLREVADQQLYCIHIHHKTQQKSTCLKIPVLKMHYVYLPNSKVISK